jgi:hypothetical protein
MKKIAMFSAMAVLAGCFTVKETDFPQTMVSALPKDKNVSVKIQGFSATVTDYMSVHSYDTVWVSGRPRGRYGWAPGHYATVSSSTYVPQIRATEFFLERARTSAEEAGFNE